MKVLLFGASGTAGGAVLQACVNARVVEEVRVVVRRSLGRMEAELREFVHQDHVEKALSPGIRPEASGFMCFSLQALGKQLLSL